MLTKTFVNPIPKIQEAICTVANPVRKIQDAILQIANPIRKTPKAILQITNPIRKIPDAILQLSNPIRKIPDAILQIANPIRKIPDAIRKKIFSRCWYSLPTLYLLFMECINNFISLIKNVWLKFYQTSISKKQVYAKQKKQSLRVDLTPMVDLGFLLIAFFVFTTTIAQPMAMKLAMPDDRSIDSSEAPANKTLNLILAANNATYVYKASDLNNIKNIGSNTTAMREAIIEKKNEIRNKYGSDSGMIVLIKPTDVSTYQNVVNALDEMLICDIKTYVLMDANAAELKAIKP